MIPSTAGTVDRFHAGETTRAADVSTDLSDEGEVSKEEALATLLGASL